MTISQAEYTIVDMNDIDISTVKPTNPVKDQLWLDTSKVPNELNRWDGTNWVVSGQNIEIGGRNLSRDTNTENWATYSGGVISINDDNGTKIMRVETGSTGHAGINQLGGNSRKMKLVEGEDYILSFDVRGTVSTLNYVYIMHVSTSNQNLRSVPVESETEFKKVTFPFTKLYDSEFSYVMITQRNAEAGEWFEFKNVQVEKGNKATDWTPAPEDVDRKITDAELRIDSTEAEIDLKVSKGDVVSEINLEPGTATINADKIDLVGLVTADYLKTLNLEVGNEIKMGANATISWANVSNQPKIPSKASDVGARPSTWTPTANDVGALPNTTHIPNKASDVGARPDTWTPTASDVGARSNTWTPSWNQVTGKPTIPVLPGYIKSTSIGSTKIESPEIIGGTISGNTITGADIIGSNFKAYNPEGNYTVRMNHEGLDIDTGADYGGDYGEYKYTSRQSARDVYMYESRGGIYERDVLLDTKGIIWDSNGGGSLPVSPFKLDLSAYPRPTITSPPGLQIADSLYTKNLYVSNALNVSTNAVFNNVEVSGHADFDYAPRIGSYEVIDSGSNSNGEYIKFYDGTMICTRSESIWNSSFESRNLGAGSLYKTTLPDRSFPITFEELHYSSAQLMGSSNATFRSNATGMKLDYGTTTGVPLLTAWRGPAIFHTREEASTNMWVHVRFFAIGRWK